MPTYRNSLPQLSDRIFLTDGGLETTVVFLHGIDLPCFAAFTLLKDEKGSGILRDYFRKYASIAKSHGLGFVLESFTWRASRDWGAQIGYSPEELDRVNREAITMLDEIRSEFEGDDLPVVISGCVGPRGDGYSADTQMTEEEAQAYHSIQIATLADTEADFVSALTMTCAEEAIGITRAAVAAEIPVVISFTTETDGDLPNGQPLRAAIEQVDAATDGAPVYYMINCAHPSHFAKELVENEAWTERIRGVRANASAKSHAELDECEELDIGDIADLANRYRKLRNRMKHLTILGGCCGTDDRHIAEIVRACLA